MQIIDSLDVAKQIASSSELHGLLIDIDDTLYDYNFSHRQAIEHVFESTLFSDLFLTFEEFYQQYRKHRTRVTQELNYSGNCRSRLLAFQALLEQIKQQNAYHNALYMDKMYWSCFIDCMQPNDDIIELVNCFKQQGKPVCAISDMIASIQIQKLERLNLIHSIDYLVTSDEVGIEKPNAKIFKRALNKLRCDASKVLMVGDDYKKDIEGAHKLGLVTFHYRQSACV